MRVEKLVAVSALGATLVASAACTTGEDAPEPEPSCQLLWASLGANLDRYDVYLVEMPRTMWVDGATPVFSYDEGVFGLFFDEFQEASPPTWSRRGVATAGSFTLGSSADAVPGGGLGFTDDGGRLYFDLDFDDVIHPDVTVASGGNGSFAGVWSPDGDEPPVPGTGSVSFTVGTSGTPQSIGSYLRYGQCFDGSSASGAVASGASRRWPVPVFPKSLRP